MNQKYGWMAIGLIGLSTACSGGGFSGDGPTANGKIVNWPAEKTSFIRVSAGKTPITSATTSVDTNGNFSNLMFPGSAQLVSSELQPFIVGPCSAGSDAVVTPTTAKIATANIQVLNNASAIAGTVSEGTADPSGTLQIGLKVVFRFYADSAVNVKGKCIFSPTNTTTFNLNLSAGWNAVIAEITEVTGTTATKGTFANGNIPSDAKFYYSVGANPLSINLFK